MNKFYAEFGRRVRERRTELRLSQGMLATHLGLSRTSVTNIERGRQHVSLHAVYAIAQALKVDAAYFLPEKRHYEETEIRLDTKGISAGDRLALEGFLKRVSVEKSQSERRPNVSDEKSRTSSEKNTRGG